MEVKGASTGSARMARACLWVPLKLLEKSHFLTPAAPSPGTGWRHAFLFPGLLSHEVRPGEAVFEFHVVGVVTGQNGRDILDEDELLVGGDDVDLDGGIVGGD